MSGEAHQGSDSVSGPVSVVIKQTGLPSTIRGHAQKLLMRWLAGTIAHPYFATVRDNLDTTEGRSRVNMMLAEEVGRQAIADPDQMERAKARFLGDTYRKQANVEAIAVAAAAKIEEQAEPTEPPKPAEEPSLDWMNAFTREAENASSDQLRDRLAKILAGEIQRPGSYSRTTVRLVGEIEQTSLFKFQSVLINRVGDRVVAPASWNSGDEYLAGLELSELGLLSSVSSSHIFKADANNKAFMIGKDYGLVLHFKSPPVQLSTSIWILSKAGLEVASLLPSFDERVALRKLAGEIEKANISNISIGRLTQLANGLVNVAGDELPYTAPPQSSTPIAMSPGFGHPPRP